MIRKLPFMLIALCFLLSCGGNDPLDIKPEDDIKPEQPEKPSEPEEPENRIKKIKSLTLHYAYVNLFKEILFTYDAKDRVNEIEMKGSGGSVDGLEELKYWKCKFEYDSNLLHLSFTDEKGRTLEKIPNKSFNLNKEGFIESAVEDDFWLFEGASNFMAKYENGCLKQMVTYYLDEVSQESTCYWEQGNIHTLKDGGSISNFYYTECKNKAGINPTLLTEYFRCLPNDICTYDPDIALDFLLHYSGIYGKSSAQLIKEAKRGKDICLFTYDFDNDGFPIHLTCSEDEYVWESLDDFEVHIQYIN